MTVIELIAELEKLPPDAPVVIEGYAKHSDDYSVMLNPEMAEATSNEVEGVRAVVWASRMLESKI
jgi:hypothetical protein